MYLKCESFKIRKVFGFRYTFSINLDFGAVPVRAKLPCLIPLKTGRFRSKLVLESS